MTTAKVDSFTSPEEVAKALAELEEDLEDAEGEQEYYEDEAREAEDRVEELKSKIKELNKSFVSYDLTSSLPVQVSSSEVRFESLQDRPQAAGGHWFLAGARGAEGN